MTEPTKIDVHSADAVRRLISFLQGKPNVEALLRCNSAARVDVRDAVNGEEYAFLVNGCRISYTAGVGDDPAVIAEELAELVNAGSGSINRDSFETYPIGQLLGEGLFGTWTALDLGLLSVKARPFVVDNAVARTGSKSIVSTFEGGLPAGGVGPEAWNGNAVFNYPGSGDDEQTVSLRFLFAPGFPGTSIPDLFFAPVGVVFYGAGPVIAFWLHLTSATEFTISIFSLGSPSPPVVLGPFPLSVINDGQWHELFCKFDQTGTSVEANVDGVYGGSGAGFGPMLTNSFAMMNVFQSSVPATDTKKVYFDDLDLGPGGSCGIIDPDTFVPTSPPESFELFTPSNPFKGAGEWATWTDTPPGGPPGPPWTPPYIGGYVVNNTDARTGSNSIRTNFSAGIGPGSGLPDPVDVIQGAIALSFPGNDQEFQKASIWFKIPSAFPGVEWETAGYDLIAIMLAFIDFSSGFILWSKFIYDGASGDYKLFIEAPGVFQSTPVVIPNAIIQDDQWHRMELSFPSEGGTVDLYVDDYRSTTTEIFSIASPVFILLTGIDPSQPSGIATVPDFYLDDLVVGGSIGRLFEFKANRENDADDFLYITPKETAGIILDVTTDVPDRIGTNKIGVVDQIQELEDTLFKILEDRWLDTAEGVQLAGLGTILGRLRTGGLTDEEYRQLLRVQITKNLSNGEPERLIEVTRILTASTIVQLDEDFPGVVDITFDGSPSNPSLLFSLLDGIAAGGVRLFLYSQSDHPFGFAGDPDAYGFNDGEFSSVIGS